MATRIEAGARVHMALIDVGRCTDRAYGGVGFSISAPLTVVIATLAPASRIAGLDKLQPRIAGKVQEILRHLETRYRHPPMLVEIVDVAPKHTGLGSSTTLLLAVIEAVCREAGICISLDEKQRISGRGGTSGIGINAFFTGGVVRDSGHPWEDIAALGPSSARRPDAAPPIMRDAWFPPGWSVALVTCAGKTISDQVEARFFEENTPIPCDEVMATQDALDTLVMPGFVDADIERLRRGVLQLGRTGFKSRELLNQSPEVKGLFSDLASLGGVAPGLSSFGPTLYAIFPKSDTGVWTRIQELASARDAALVRAEAMNGSGHVAVQQ